MRLAACAVVAAALSAAATVPSRRSDPIPLRLKGRDGMACVNCHSPDGIELAAFGFPRADIVRRALGHLSQPDADRVADYIEGAHPYKTTLSFETARPLQPGGRVLEGKTPLERDAAFAKELATLVPSLDGPPIRTVAVALETRDKILALDPRTVPIGIPFSFLSEDVYHGAAHASIADWIPDVGLPIDAAFLELEDKYLADPSDANLLKLESVVAKSPAETPIIALAKAKFRCLLLLQHAIRLGGLEGARLDRIKLIGKGNPFWDVAEFGNHEASADAETLGMPDSVKKKKLGVPFAEQMKRLRLPWYWLGWSLDPSLTHMLQGLDHQGIRADYFTLYLWNDGPYPMHMAFMLTKKLVDAGYAQGVAPSGFPRHFELQYSNLLRDGRLLKFTPSLDKDQQERLFANVLRLGLLLLDDDIEKTGGCLRPESQLFEISEIRDYLHLVGGPEDAKLCDAVSALVKSARVDGR